MQAKDIADVDFLEAVRAYNDGDFPPEAATEWKQPGHHGWAFYWDIARWKDWPERVTLAKAGRLIRRGLITGCICGCRGDFELTANGRAVLTG